MRLLVALSAVLQFARSQPRASIEGPAIRVEAAVVAGKLHERFHAREGRAWIELAAAGGRTLGALSVADSAGFRKTGAVISLSAGRGTLVEELAIGTLRVRRTLSLTGRERWLRAATRLEGGLPVALHSFSDQVRTTIEPAWSYSPSVGGFNPEADYKAPLVLVQSGHRAFGIVPDLLVLTRDVLKRCNHALDLDAPAGPLLSVGFIPARHAYHSVFREDLGRLWNADQPVENAYYLYLSADAAPGEAFREAVRFHWSRFGRHELPVAATAQAGTDPAYRHCELWDDWRRVVWDRESPANWLSFPLPGGSTGGAVRMIRWGGPRPSVYLGAWFNSLRTAYGMALYARRAVRPRLLDLAGQTLQMALKAPGREGAFKCIAVPQGAIGPVTWAAGDGSGESVASGFLGFDMSWTAYWLLKWREAGLPGGAEVLDRCARLAEFFLARQQPDGMLPTRFDEDGGVQPGASRVVMAETAPVALFLLELYKASLKPQYLAAARKGLEFLQREVIPGRKWYDFETFWSCSPRLLAFDERTRQWPANDLALIHAAAAFLAAFQVTRERLYLDRGQALLDYLLLYQQSWTNPALDGLTGPAMLLGGFTTQNSDAEWSDARQSLAGNVLLDYYRAAGNVEYLERGVEALRAQFPVSPSENWAHSGYGGKAGVSSFHWGTGSGMAGIEIEEEYLKDGVFDVSAQRAVGVNGLNLTDAAVEGHRIRFSLDSPFRWSRKPVIVFRHTRPDQVYELTVNGHVIGTFPGRTLETGVPLPNPVPAAEARGQNR
jgi:hypothetical protein